MKTERVVTINGHEGIGSFFVLFLDLRRSAKVKCSEKQNCCHTMSSGWTVTYLRISQCRASLAPSVYCSSAAEKHQ